MFILVIVVAIAFTRLSTALLDNHRTLAILLGPLTLLGTDLMLKVPQILSEIIHRIGTNEMLLGLTNLIEFRLKIKDPKNYISLLQGISRSRA